jgi:hypothetical protein
MAGRFKNRLIALLLLVVFSVNTIAGLACSIGINMGYNADHHKRGKRYSHRCAKGHNKHKHNHLNSTITQFNDGNSKDDCCSNNVTKFALLDKSVVANIVQSKTSIVLSAFTKTFVSQTINQSGLTVNPVFQFVRRSSFLNDRDIQTAIRRFQI